MQTLKRQYYGLLKANVFLTCLLILLVNDFYLKSEFPGLITGKLSDFAGLFAFPYFVAVLLPKNRQTIYILTGVLFIFWKLSLSDWIINVFNSLEIISIHRVKDLTDLTALVILPISFKYFERQITKTYVISRVKISFLLILSLFTFTADSIGYQDFKTPYSINSSYLIPISKDLLIKRHFLSVYTGTPINLKDSLYYVEFHHPDKSRVDILFNAKIKSIKKDSCIIKIDSINYEIQCEGLFSGPEQSTVEEMNTLTANDFKSLIEKNVIIQILRNDTTKRFYMRSNRTEDSLQKRYN
ncbi:MAG: hypothetical protein JNM51_13655 [Bacteroidia bacterium]|nr:hypothetical protein [Bacteroidia bacterium]